MTAPPVNTGVFLRFKKLKGPGIVLLAARHNLRELPLTPNIIPGKQGANRVVWGELTPKAVYAAYRVMLEAAGHQKLRKDAVRAIECLVSLPVGVCDADGCYFTAALDWLRKEFDHDNVLSAVIHNDESAQHMHVLVVPLVDGRMRGSDLLGGLSQFRALRRRFEQAIGPAWQHLGLAAKPGQSNETMARETIAYLQRMRDPLWQSAVAQIIRNCIESDPAPFYQSLGFPEGTGTGTARDTAPEPVVHNQAERSAARQQRRSGRHGPQPTMAEIFTRPVRNMRGTKSERYRQSAEYLQAHGVPTPCAREGARVHDVVPLTMNPDAASPSLPMVLPTLDAAPPLPLRTLCSVGFSSEQHAFLGVPRQAAEASTQVAVARQESNSPRRPPHPPLNAPPHRITGPNTLGDPKIRLEDDGFDGSGLHRNEPPDRPWQWPPARAPA